VRTTTIVISRDSKHTRTAHLLISIILQIYLTFLMFDGAKTIKHPPKSFSSSIEKNFTSIICAMDRKRVFCFDNAK